MKRDMELVRQILIAIEDHPHAHAPDSIDVPDYDEETISYHLVLMAEAGLLLVEESTTFQAHGPSAIVSRMTWDGHEFLDNARNDTVWTKVKAIVTAKGGSVSFEVLQAMVVEAAKSYFLPGVLPGLPPQP